MIMAAAALTAAAIAGGCSGKSVSQTGAGDDADSCRVPDTLRVATLYSPTSYFFYRDQTMGYDYDMLRSIAENHGVELDIHVAPSLSSAVEWLDSGKIDLIAYEVPVTAEYKDRVVACGDTSVTRQVLVQPRDAESPVTDVTELIGREVYVEKDSKYHHRLANLNKELGGGIIIRPVEADTLITEDLIGMVADGGIPLTIVDSDIARLNRTYYPGLNIGLELSNDQRAAWGVSPNKKWLADSIDAWTEGAESRKVRASLLKRYFELSKREPSNYSFDFSRGRISEYDDLFRKASEPYDWDWRLLSAQAFVESRFNSSAVSWAGARGMMQIMPATARAYGVSAGSLSDNKTSVELSLKIIKELDKMLAPKVADPVERRKFIIAAYNSGIAHILDAIALAKVTGRDPQKWNGNVETALLLKSNPEYYNNPVVRYGYFRGRETTDYVRKVTDFYNRAIKSVKA